MGRIIVINEISKQVASIIYAIDDDKAKLYSCLIETHTFIECEELQGIAWDGIKSQIERHNAVIQGIICMLDELKNAGIRLITLCGEENLNEDELLEVRWRLLCEIFDLQSNIYALKNSPDDIIDYQAHISGNNTETSNRELIFYYNHMIESNFLLIEQINKKIEKLDEIDYNTKQLNSEVERIKADVELGIESLRSTVSDDGKKFVYVMGSNMTWMSNIDAKWNSDKKPLSDAETYTPDDFKKLEISKTNENIYVSSNKQSLFYRGVIYTICSPD